jgi:hypothetical protein
MAVAKICSDGKTSNSLGSPNGLALALRAPSTSRPPARWVHYRVCASTVSRTGSCPRE